MVTRVITVLPHKWKYSEKDLLERATEECNEISFVSNNGVTF